MARLVANLIIYLCLLCSIIKANESGDSNVQDSAAKVAYKTPEISGFAYLVETFDDEEKFKKSWVLSEAKKDSVDEDIAKYDGYNLSFLVLLIYIFSLQKRSMHTPI